MELLFSMFQIRVIQWLCGRESWQTVNNDDDLNFENILIDKTSADLLKGSEVDYVSELIGESFKISNPQTKSSCGCGVSFSL